MSDPELPGAESTPRAETTPDERNLALLAHLGVLAGYLVAVGHILVPLLVWLMKRDESEFVAEHALESLNFQISMTLWIGISVLLSFVLIGLPMLVVFGLINLVCVVLATMKASKGEHYRYPLTIRLVS
ncbi:MAG: DUF4870 domain-containing protein [Myxococcota bacterium]|nr:DUF4870 domain-containing protein [Myxococcota bacterium]